MRIGEPVLFIHGGAGASSSSEQDVRIRRRLRAICERAHRYLAGRSALEAVLFAVRWLEDDPLFNAGTGSVLQRDRKARMSASVMDGARMRFAGVLNIQRVRNPVLVARALLEREDRVLAGPEAQGFARSAGFVEWNPVTPERARQWREAQSRPYGTVGAVARDRRGRLAAATSSGGKPGAMAGRVSDSGTPAGNYADGRVAISCTGIGEEILDEALAARVTQRVSDGMSLAKAMRGTFQALRARNRRVAAIAVDRRGRPAWATTLPALFAVGRMRDRWIETF